MGDTGDSKNNLIKHIFEKMEYGNDLESITDAVDWLKTKENSIFAYIDKKDESPNGEGLSIKNANSREDLCRIYVPDGATVDTILTKTGGAQNKWHDTEPTVRAEAINQLGNEIRKKQNLFTQLEIAARGILSKDTKNKNLPLLTDAFHYYSSFSVKHSTNSSWKPEGLVICILPDESPLWILGYVLGPCLALGYKVVLQTGPQLSLIATLLIDLATNVGIPEGTIRLIPGNVDPNTFFGHSTVSVISIFDDLYKEKYQIANHFNKKVLHFSSSGSSMIIFENCDLDSACHGIIDAVWGYKGMLPWSVRNIFIQENIFENFTSKLKNKINQLKVGSSDKKNTDITYPNPEVLEKLNEMTGRAKSEGVDIFQTSLVDNFAPTLLIGPNVFPNNVIKEDYVNVPLATLNSFRTINEAVALCNNTRQGLGVSVWTESTSLAHEIVDKLKTGNIWINSHGLFSVETATSPHKTSGNAYFGGYEGYCEYLPTKTLKNEAAPQTKNADAMEKSIGEAKKAQVGWCNLGRLGRNKVMQEIIKNINSNKSKWKLQESWAKEWIQLIYEYMSLNLGDSFLKTKSFNVVNIREPCGIVAVETLDVETHNKRLIIAALLEGNSIIVLNDSKDADEFYSSVSKLVPKGVFTVLTHSQDATKVAALHKELNLYVGEKNNKVFSSLPLKTSAKFKTVNENDWNQIRNKVTLVKNVWFNKGQSFI